MFEYLPKQYELRLRLGGAPRLASAAIALQIAAAVTARRGWSYARRAAHSTVRAVAPTQTERCTANDVANALGGVTPRLGRAANREGIC